MARIVSIAAIVGFFAPIAWLAAVWVFILTGHEAILDHEQFVRFSQVICPPFFLQLTISAPWINAALYASATYLVVRIFGLYEQKRV